MNHKIHEFSQLLVVPKVNDLPIFKGAYKGIKNGSFLVYFTLNTANILPLQQQTQRWRAFTLAVSRTWLVPFSKENRVHVTTCTIFHCWTSPTSIVKFECVFCCMNVVLLLISGLVRKLLVCTTITPAFSKLPPSATWRSRLRLPSVSAQDTNTSSGSSPTSGTSYRKVSLH